MIPATPSLPPIVVPQVPTTAPPTPAVSRRPPPEDAGGIIPWYLRGKARTSYLLKHWRDLEGKELGEFGFYYLTARTFEPAALTRAIPLPVFQALPGLYPERFKDRQFADFGFIPDPSDPFGLPVGLKTGGTEPPAVDFTCAACHVGMVAGRLTPGAANSALRYADFVLELEAVRKDRSLTSERIEEALKQLGLPALAPKDREFVASWLGHRAEVPAAVAEPQTNWGPGRVALIGAAPIRIPALFGARDRFLCDGIFQAPAERCRYQFWSSGAPLESLRRPNAERILGALDDYWMAFKPPGAFGSAEAGQLTRGKKVFENNCAVCHRDRSNQLIPLEEVGTDGLRFRPGLVWLPIWLWWQGFRDVNFRWWPGVKIPELQGMLARKVFLHNGSVPTLEDLLSAPAKRPPVFAIAGGTFDTRLAGNSNRGHVFGTDLSEEDRGALLDYLRSL